MPSDVRLDGEVVHLDGQRVQTLGQLAVGTTAPQRQLHVHGGEIHSSGGGAGFSFANREAKAFVDKPAVGERWVLHATGGRARLWSGGDKLVVTPGGRVGIGHPDPQRQLHVHGSEIHSSGGGAGFSFENREAKTFVDHPAAGERWVLHATGGRASLWSGGHKLVVTPGGRVGIGTPDPFRQLHVHGLEVHSSGGGAGYSFADQASTTPFVESPTNGERWRWFASGGTARLWSGSEKLVITATGNVGIGTTTPKARLHVEGKVRFSRSGVLNVPGGTQAAQVNVPDVDPETLVFAVVRSLESMAPNGPNIFVRAARATAVGSIAVTLSAPAPAGSTLQVAWFALD